MRSELIPQITAGVDLGSGVRYYHFSVSVGEENFPDAGLEHQVGFFEVRFPRSSPLLSPEVELYVLTGSKTNIGTEPLHRTKIRRLRLPKPNLVRRRQFPLEHAPRSGGVVQLRLRNRLWRIDGLPVYIYRRRTAGTRC